MTFGIGFTLEGMYYELMNLTRLLIATLLSIPLGFSVAASIPDFVTNCL